MKIRVKHFFYILPILFAVAACKQGDDQSTLTVQSEPIHKTYEQQPVRLDYIVSHSVIRVADRLEVSLSFYAPEDYEVALPKVESTLGEFEIADQYEDLPELADKGSLLHKKTIALEPFLAGGYSIPPLKIEYWEKEKTENKKSLTTDEVQIRVSSLIEKEQQNIDISDIVPPVPLPSKRIYWILAAIFLVVVIIGGLLWWRGKRIGQENVRPLEPAHIRAFNAFDALMASGLLKEGRIKEFYLSISDILRRYIENRFTLHAPERTTEEFLTELGATKVLQLPHKTLLKEFLVHCDQVKFAKYQPVDEEIQKTMDICRQFINDTKQTDIEGGKGA